MTRFDKVIATFLLTAVMLELPAVGSLVRRVSSQGDDLSAKAAILKDSDSNTLDQKRRSRDKRNIGSCGGVLIGSTGFLASPNYPNYYDNNAYCTWRITARNQHVHLQFLAFELESCCDRLRIYDGSTSGSPLFGMYSSSMPPDITSSSESLYLQFESDGSITRRGFHASYTAITAGSLSVGGSPSVCDSSPNAITSFGGVFKSHDAYPASSYESESESNCSLTVNNFGSYTHVYIKFTEIALYNNHDCSNPYGDAIVVRDDDSQIDEFCNQHTAEQEYVADSGLTIQFDVRSAVEGVITTDDKGFKGVYSIYYTAFGGCSNFQDFFCAKSFRCISKTLVCDGHDHCGDNTDESGCGPGILSIIAGSVVAAIFVVVTICCYKYHMSSRSATAPVPANQAWTGNRRNDLPPAYDEAQRTPRYPNNAFQSQGNLPQSAPPYGGDPAYPPTGVGSNAHLSPAGSNGVHPVQNGNSYPILNTPRSTRPTPNDGYSSYPDPPIRDSSDSASLLQ
ncbi:neuropilin and tolloid-like protein 2 [Ptychodera flava]|uniref:neuropilin and tolloid-like protein 2 n=1 Tax=Ptychodera flava TaxID=63121 RepID=UPI00396A78A0